jgi:endonuclease G
MKKNSKSLKTNIILILLGLIIFICLPKGQEETATQNNSTVPDGFPIENVEIRIENVEIPARLEDRKEQIIVHTGHTVSYNSDRKIPNWVAYELTKEEAAGKLPRSNSFTPDPNILKEESAIDDDYKNSGWDRGHLAPAADMKWDRSAMKASFYFSNICPQNRNLNAGDWKDLEEQTRSLAMQKGKIYVVCGPIVSKKPGTIGQNSVVIPDAFFKVLLQNDEEEWAAIAFMFPNESGKSQPISTYAMSVEEIEAITGIDFFHQLPDSIEERIENRVDFMKWNIK